MPANASHNLGESPEHDIQRLRGLTGALAIGLAMWAVIAWGCLAVVGIVAHLYG
jgi:hypothetical protein